MASYDADKSIPIAIAGSGAAGLFSALLLYKKGYRNMMIFEPGARTGGTIESYNTTDGKQFDLGPKHLIYYYDIVFKLLKEFGYDAVSLKLLNFMDLQGKTTNIDYFTGGSSIKFLRDFFRYKRVTKNYRAFETGIGFVGIANDPILAVTVTDFLHQHKLMRLYNYFSSVSVHAEGPLEYTPMAVFMRIFPYEMLSRSMLNSMPFLSRFTKASLYMPSVSYTQLWLDVAKFLMEKGVKIKLCEGMKCVHRLKEEPQRNADGTYQKPQVSCDDVEDALKPGETHWNNQMANLQDPENPSETESVKHMVPIKEYGDLIKKTDPRAEKTWLAVTTSKDTYVFEKVLLANNGYIGGTLNTIIHVHWRIASDYSFIVETDRNVSESEKLKLVTAPLPNQVQFIEKRHPDKNIYSTFSVVPSLDYELALNNTREAFKSMWGIKITQVLGAHPCSLQTPTIHTIQNGIFDQFNEAQGKDGIYYVNNCNSLAYQNHILRFIDKVLEKF